MDTINQLMFMRECRHIVGSHRPTEILALPDIAAELFEHGYLLRIFNAFSNDFQP